MMRHFWRFTAIGLLVALLGSTLIVHLPVDTVRAQADLTITPTDIPIVNDPPESLGFNEATSTILNNLELDVRTVRELELRQPLDRRLVVATDLLAFASTQLLNDYSTAQAQADARFYGAFGFMPEDTDLQQITRNLVAEQLTVYYDAERNILFVPDFGGLSSLVGVVYAHEYAQALLQENFDVAPLLAETNFDRHLAMQALIEGDAQLATARYTELAVQRNPAVARDLLTQTVLSNPPVYNNAPAILRAELNFPYQAGTEFVQRLYDQIGNWTTVNQAYTQPPVSTEQILHPDLYLQNHQPQTVTVQPIDEFLAERLSGDEWVLLFDQTFGEFYLREHMAQKVERSVAESAAAGWGGDQFLLYGQATSPNTILVWRLAWDTEQDTSEFNDLYGAFLAVWLEVGGVVVNDDLTCWERPAKSVCRLAVGDETLIVMAPTLELATQIIEYQLEVSEF